MAYCNLHEDILKNHWFMTLPDREARTFLHLLAYAASDEGHIFSTDLDWVASRIGRKPSSLRSLLTLSEGRIVAGDNEIIVRDWSQWNKPRDLSTNRVRSYRERKRVSETITKRSSETGETSKSRVRVESESESEKDVAHNTVSNPESDLWNKLCTEIKLLNKDTVKRLSSEQKAKLVTRRQEPDFDMQAICDAIRDATHLHTPSGKGWLVSFNWLIDSEKHYSSILRQGRIARDAPPPPAQQGFKPPGRPAESGGTDDYWQEEAERQAARVQAGEIEVMDCAPAIRAAVQMLVTIKGAK